MRPEKEGEAILLSDRQVLVLGISSYLKINGFGHGMTWKSASKAGWTIARRLLQTGRTYDKSAMPSCNPAKIIGLIYIGR